MKLGTWYSGLQTLPRHIMAVSLSAATVHLCADKTRVFDIKPWWELTHTQDKCPPIHHTIKCPKIQVLSLCGVSFQMKSIPHPTRSLWQYNFHFTHPHAACQSICSNSWDRFIIMPSWNLTSKSNVAFLPHRAAGSALCSPNVSIQKTNHPVQPSIT